MIIISGSNGSKYNAEINHKNYADYHGIDYHYYTDIDYEQGIMKRPSYIKTYAIRNALELHNKVMWIDDDAFFIDFNWDCRSVFEQYTKPWIVSQSHATKSSQPILNSGVMFYRRDTNIINMLQEIPNMTDAEKMEMWQPEWGTTKGNDQPRYIIMSQTKYKDYVDIVPYELNKWNKKREHCMRSHHYIVHFAGARKQDRISNFEKTIGVNFQHKTITWNQKRKRYTSQT